MIEDYRKLLRKYKTQDSNEKWSKESEIKKVQNWRNNETKRTANLIMNEFNLVGTQRDEVLNILNQIPFEEIYRTTNQEKIILTVCLYVKKIYSNTNRKRVPEDYAICKKYGLTTQIAYNITTRLLNFFREKSFLKLKNEV